MTAVIARNAPNETNAETKETHRSAACESQENDEKCRTA
jgi:hypothetical protein